MTVRVGVFFFPFMSVFVFRAQSLNRANLDKEIILIMVDIPGEKKRNLPIIGRIH